jgi:hypothetical protein
MKGATALLPQQPATAAMLLCPTFLLPLGIWRCYCSPLQPFND